MKKVQHGCVTVVVPEEIAPPERAGKMSKKEVKRLLKSPQHMGSVCRQSADALERLGVPFVLPRELSPEEFRQAAVRSEEIAKVMQDLVFVVRQLSQAKRLFDHDTFDKLRYLRDLVSTYAKYHPELRMVFAPLFELFGRSARTRKERQKKVRAEREKASPGLIRVAEGQEVPEGFAG